MFTIPLIEIKAIENDTRNGNLKWLVERKGCITASNFVKVLKCKNSHDSILLDIMGHEDNIHTKAIAWGKNKKKLAQDKFNKLSTLCT